MPTRGTTLVFASSLISVEFQFTCPRGARLNLHLGLRDFSYFNSRAHEGHDLEIAMKIWKILISIHVPTRGTTLKNIYYQFPYKCLLLTTKYFWASISSKYYHKLSFSSPKLPISPKKENPRTFWGNLGHFPFAQLTISPHPLHLPQALTPHVQHALSRVSQDYNTVHYQYQHS